LVKDFLVKNSVTTLENPPYCPDLASGNFYLFLRLKSALKGQRFCNITDIIKNETEELKRLSQNGFQEYFQNIYIRWDHFITAQRDYFEGNVD
jgi:hypothetical protein